jgi:hypothetical protein
MVSTTARFWVAVSRDDEPVREVECFVAADGRVVPVPTGYAMKVGADVFATKADAEAEVIKRIENDIAFYRKWLASAEKRLARLKGAA